MLFTDGVLAAGQRRGKSLDLLAIVQRLYAECDCDAQFIADQLLAEALQLDEGRASDDISILTLAVCVRQARDAPAGLSGADVRRLSLTVPL